MREYARRRSQRELHEGKEVITKDQIFDLKSLIARKVQGELGLLPPRS